MSISENFIIDRDFTPYGVFADESIRTGLQKINANREGIIFCMNRKGILLGVLTDGDFRRWVVDAGGSIDLEQPIESIMNQSFTWLYFDDPYDRLKAAFNAERGIRFIPLLDHSRRLIAYARERSSAIAIDGHIIGPDDPVYIIAEIGNNHNGDEAMARRLIEEAARAGADCAKFQMRNMESLYRNASESASDDEDLGTQYTLDLLSRNQLSNDILFGLFDYARELGLTPLCTPWDKHSLDALEKYGMPAYKIASADLTNHDLLTAAAQTGKPLICSTGMSTESEIQSATELLNGLGAQYVLLHCNSTYPAPFKDLNLKYMQRLARIGACTVGYSSHERGHHVCTTAVGMGARLIEKHFTLDRNLEGNDHRVSLLPDEFASMVRQIREVESAMGVGNTRVLSQGEMINREVLGKSLVINTDLKQWEVIKEEMVEVRSPGQGLPPYRKKELIGQVARRNFKKWDMFFASDLGDELTEPGQYDFNRSFGIPIRFHDFQELHAKSNFGLVEFHLSFKDLEVELERHLRVTPDLDFVVHAPELFAGDHILDLCVADGEARRHSIAEMQRVIDITRALKTYFPDASPRPLIITNVGGFTLDEPVRPADRRILYDHLLESLAALDSDGVEVIIQTMPPFPWHFGGQRYHNLFVDPEEIRWFCDEYGMRMCLDVSHSAMACNQEGWDLEKFLQEVGPFSAHLHLADAQGVDGEGIQIGEGTIDFQRMFQILKEVAPEASFVPEIWQGHKNGGMGFWIALERLASIYVRANAEHSTI